MRNLFLVLAAITAIFVGLGVGIAQGPQQVPNPAMTDPDQQAWRLFLAVNQKVPRPGANDALFETWANDGDTFKPVPAWPTTPSAGKAAPRALSLVLQRAHAAHVGPIVEVVPGGTDLVSEETRHNRPDFDFIVQNRLFKVSGLQAAFTAGKTLTFPIDSMEVKANWVEVGRLKEFNGFTGTPADAAKIYHVNSAGGKQYALVAFHIISKLVPNWTWATFEHKDNPGRCDILGCRDSFGAQIPYVAPLSTVESKTHYPNCAKTAALTALLSQAKIDPAFTNYCLKGSQSDFTDPSGLVIRVGNSVTEQGFVAQASCMSCHGRAAFDATGHATSFAGFDPLTINTPLTSNAGNGPIGPIDSRWYWVAGGPPSYPSLVGEQDLTRIALPADFVWSIPFCAIDDTTKPPETKSRFCSAK
ncbi:hypothetical protein GCM10009087_37590 [Sphingomonas oligophenolica]|uniref:Cytochrome c domain-containing protein n=1 Tax=Sphingomonas oligophenolica TaxID=301154 RepID=A0ABU9YA86_9SPHN